MRIVCLSVATLLLFASCDKKNTVLKHGNLVLNFDHQMHSMVGTAAATAKPMAADFTASEYLMSGDIAVNDFVLTGTTSVDYHGALGTGKKWTLSGHFQDERHSIDKVVEIKFYD